MGFPENFSLKSIELNEKRVIRDAIHDYIHVDHLIIWRLINSQEMQRLRRIKQLGGTYQVFQSAEHSRFVHSLGVYQVVRRMLETECLSNALNDYDKALYYVNKALEIKKEDRVLKNKKIILNKLWKITYFCVLMGLKDMFF